MRNQFLYILLNKLEQSGLNYAVIRGWENIPDSMSGGDLDLWIDRSQYIQFIRILHEALVEADGCVVSFLDNLMVPKYTFLGMDWGLQMDAALHATQYRCADSLPEKIIWKNIVYYNGYKVIAPKADAYMAFFKEVLNNGYCQKEQYISNLRNELKVSSPDEIKDNLCIYSDATIQTFQQQVLDEKRTEFNGLRKMLCREFLPCVNIRYMHNQLMKWRRIFQHPGYVIAVLGTDGSGKSAIIDAITPWLDEAFHNGVRYFHLRPGLLPDIAVLFGKRTKEECHPAVASNPHIYKPSGFFGSMARLLYYLMDYSFGYFWKVWRQIALHSKVVIFDRYYYDYYFDAWRYLVSLPRWILRAFEIFVPQPDIILCLGGDPNIIYSRKQETTLEEVMRQTEDLKLFATQRSNAVWIDTTQSIEDSVHDAKRAILSGLSKRFRKVL